MFFSLIIPVYNVENELERCLDSIVKQDFKDYEIILVDDGSTDSSGMIADRYRAKNVTVIHRENGGLSAARNEGMKYAKGDYVWFIDSDDMIAPNALSTARTVLSRDRSDILAFDFEIVGEDGTIVKSESPVPAGILKGESKERFCHYTIYNYFTNTACTVWKQIYRRTLIADVPFVSEREVYSEDAVFNGEVLLKAKTISVLHEPFYRYYRRRGSLVMSTRAHLKEDIHAYTLLKSRMAKTGDFETYRNELNKAYLDDSILGGHRENGGSVVSEYMYGKDQAEARKGVQEILCGEDFRKMMKDAEGRPLSTMMQELHAICRKEDENSLYHYLGTLNEQKQRLFEEWKIVKKCDFEMMPSKGGFIAVPVGDNASVFHGVLNLDAQAAKSLQYILSCRTMGEVLDALQKEYPAETRDGLRKALVPFAEQLNREGLIA